MTDQKTIRPIAICLITDQDRLFVFEAQDPATGQTFYRPLGGGIEFGELGAQCIARELLEEIGAELEEITYLETLEAIFVYNGQPSHELVRVYQARFAHPDRYRDTPVLVHDEGHTFPGRWMSVADFRNGAARLVPEGLLQLLD